MRALLSAFAWLFAAVASAQPSTVLTFDGTVPTGSETHFFLPFEVPAGVVEIEVRHDDGSAENILDFGLEDAHGFRGWGGGNSEPAVVGLDRASRSYVPGPIDAGTWRVVVGKAKLVQLPAGYHVEVELRYASTLAAQPERSPYQDPGPLRTSAGWYAGDFHVHSRESGDASATLDQIATLATSRGLDFVAITDHNTHTALDYLNDAQSRHPTMLFVPSVEFTTYAGHANAVGATSWVDHRIGVEGATIAAAAAAYHAQGALFSPNHPEFMLGDLCIGCAWEHALPPEAIDSIEIMTTGLPIVQSVFFDATIARWDALSDLGAHVAAIGGSDDHRAGSGSGSLDAPIGNPTTMVYAEELSVAGILEGIRRGRTVVKVTGPDAPMVELDANAPLDRDTVRATATTLVATVTGGVGTTLLWFENGVAVGDAVAITDATQLVELAVRAPRVGESRYRVELYGNDGRVTVTSHVYVTRSGADVGEPGCGCRVTAGAPSGGSRFVVLAFGALLGFSRLRARRARRRDSGTAPRSCRSAR